MENHISRFQMFRLLGLAAKTVRYVFGMCSGVILRKLREAREKVFTLVLSPEAFPIEIMQLMRRILPDSR